MPCMRGFGIGDYLSEYWVPLFHALFRSKIDVQRENNAIGASIVQQDLQTCRMKMDEQEQTLTRRVHELSKEAFDRRCRNDKAGAIRKLRERQRVGTQLTRVQSTLALLDMHTHAVEGAEMDHTIIETLRASTDALKRIGVDSGIKDAEQVVEDVRTQMEKAMEITNTLLDPNGIGEIMSTSMQGSGYISEADLEAELNQLMDDEGSEADFLNKLRASASEDASHSSLQPPTMLSMHRTPHSSATHLAPQASATLPFQNPQASVALLPTQVGGEAVAEALPAATPTS